MSKEETYNGVDNNGPIEGERAGSSLQFSESSGEVVNSDNKGKSDPSIDRAVNDQLTNDQCETDLTQREGISSNNKGDKVDTTESTLTSESQSGSEDEKKWIHDDSNSAKVSQSGSEPDLSLSVKDDKEQLESKNTSEETSVTVDDNCADRNSVTESVGVIQKNRGDADREDPTIEVSGTHDTDIAKQTLSDQNSVNSHNESVVEGATPLTQREIGIEINEEESIGKKRKGSSENSLSSRSNTPEIPKEVISDNIVSDKESFTEVSQSQIAENDESEQYGDDFEDADEKDTIPADNTVNEQSKDSDDQTKTESVKLASEETNKELETADAVQDKADDNLTDAVQDKADDTLTDAVQGKADDNLANAVQGKADDNLTDAVQDKADDNLADAVQNKADENLADAVQNKADVNLANAVQNKADDNLTDAVQGKADHNLAYAVQDKADDNLEKEDVCEDDYKVTDQFNGNNDNIVENSEQKHPQSNEVNDNSASCVEGSEIDKTTGQPDDTTEPELETTKVVVDAEGIPKVLVTTVPDRPPSSQCDVDENTDFVEEREYEKENDGDNNDISVDRQSTVDDKPNTNNEDPEVDKQSLNGENNQANDIEKSEDNNHIAENSIDKTNTKLNEENIDQANKDSSKNEEIANKPVNDDVVHEDAKETSSVQNDESTDDLANGKTKFTTESIAERAETPHEKTDDQMDSQANGNVEPTAAPASEANPSGPNVEKSNDVNDDITKKDAEQGNAKKAGERNETPPVEVEKKKVEKVESPLDKLLKRHVEIDGTTESITQLEQHVMTLLTSMKDVMSHYSERLKLQTLKDITEDMGKFRGDFTSVNEAFQTYSSMNVNINQKLKELRHVTEDVKSQISRKFVSEDLGTWVDATPEQEKEKEKLYDETIATEKAAMMKAAEARQAMATATVGVAKASQFVTELEVQTAEAEAIAVKAAAQAKASLIAAEEARKAAEQRRIAEEASKARADERARVKAAEAKKKEAEEEKVIHMEAAKKGTSVEDERTQFMKEKARKEAERRNPKNWPKYSYEAAGKDFNPSVGCIIRAIEGSMRQRDVDCVRLDQSTDVLKLRENEELVSNIIRVNPTDADRKFSFEEPMSIALPVCFNRIILGREAVVKQLVSSGAWKELPSADVQFEEFREARFVEGRSRTFGTFAVVLRLKKDSVQFGKRAGRVVSSVDTRITFTNQNGTFKQLTNGILEVQSLDVNTIPELKFRAPVECENLLTSSPIIRLTLPAKKMDKPLMVSIPLPHVQTKQSRPATSISRPVATDDVRPATARPSANKEEEHVEDIRFLFKDEKNGWTVNKKLELTQLKNKDIVVFDTVEPYERFILLRTKPGVKDNALEKMATLIERALTQRNVKVSLRQNQHEASDVTIVCTPSIRTKKALQNLEEDGYSEGPPPSPDLILQEGQQLYMKFRGNIHCVDENPSLDLIFNSYIRATRKVHVTEIDVFAQKSIHCYRGFLQIFTKALVPKPQTEGSQKTAAPEMVESEILLTELLVELPKPEVEPPKPLCTAPISLNDSPLTHPVFRHLASELGNEWRALGTHLNLPATRIQAILRQNVNKETPQTRYDMLVTWAKRIPKGVDKTQILYNALLACGRHDLAEEVRYKGDEFRQQRLNKAKSSHLKQAFVKVAKCQAVFKHWQTFAKRLGVPEEEIERIDESGGSGQQKCYTSLAKWGQAAGDEASIQELSSQLKHVKQPTLSKEVESIVLAS